MPLGKSGDDRMFWDAKRVLITGHTGFKGSWLSILLRKFGAEVIGYALDPKNSADNFVVCGLSNKITDIRGNICDYNKLEKVFAEYRPELVFHLAAQPLVLASYKDIRGTYETNVMGTLNVLECIKACPETKAAVIVTTDKCYENNEQILSARGYRETDRLGGYDPYSSSKACAEILVSSYRNSFFSLSEKAIATARAGNVIGGGDWSADRIVPDCINSFMNDGKIEIRNPHATRPWQHVIEPLYGYMMLAQQLYCKGAEYSEAWNFGPDAAGVTNVWELASLLLSELGSGSLIDKSSKSAVHEANFLSLDITKVSSRLGWYPSLSIGQAVKMTADWYKQYYKASELESEIFRLCEVQIDFYLKRLRGIANE